MRAARRGPPPVESNKYTTGNEKLHTRTTPAHARSRSLIRNRFEKELQIWRSFGSFGVFDGLGSSAFGNSSSCVGVRYLEEPEAVFAEIGRVLILGGACVISSSDRFFNQKALVGWIERGMKQWAQLVADYFWAGRGRQRLHRGIRGRDQCDGGIVERGGFRPRLILKIVANDKNVYHPHPLHRSRCFNGLCAISMSMVIVKFPRITRGIVM